MERPVRCIGVFAAITLSSVVVVGVAAPVASQTTGQIPAQYVTKLATEALGDVPSATGWNVWATAFFGASSCNASTAATWGKNVYKSATFTSLGYDNVARLSALYRGALNRDVTGADLALFLNALNTGTVSWNALVDAVFASSGFTTLVPQICSSTEPSYGFGGSGAVDLRAASGQGASRTQAQLQTALNSAAGACGVVSLQPYELIRVGGDQPTGADYIPLTIPSCVTLQTVGLPARSQYAAMGRIAAAGAVCGADGCSTGAIVQLRNGATLRSVWVDGSTDAESTAGLALVATDSGLTNTTIAGVRFTDPPRGGAALDLTGRSTSPAGAAPVACGNRFVSGSLVTAYGRKDDQTGLGAPLWTDGFRIQCEQAAVTANALVDISGTAISVMGSWNSALGNTGTEARAPQSSAVTDNVIVNAGINGAAGIEVDPAGMCRAEDTGPPVACIEFSDVRDDSPGLSPTRSFAGAVIGDNSLWTSSVAHVDVGILVGGFARLGRNAPLGTDIVVSSNDTGGIGLRAQTGILISGALLVNLTGNDLSGHTQVSGGSHWGGGCEGGKIVAGFYIANFVAGSTQPTWASPLDTAWCLIPTPPSVGREPIAAQASSLVGAATGKVFTPWGHNHSLSHIQTRSELVMVRNLGANTLRIHPQFRDMMDASCVVDPTALGELRQTADDAAELGIYLDITGLGSFASDSADPPCYRNTTRQERWSKQQQFWEAIALELKDHPAVLMFDLMNEPISATYTTPGVCWTGDPALTPPLPPGCFEDFADSGQYFNQHIHRDTNVVPGVVANAWMSQLSSAINAIDPDRLITVGCLSFVNCGLGVTVADLAAHLDVLSVHVYPVDCTGGCGPFAGGTELTGPLESELSLMADFAAPGKPVIVEEIFPLASDTQLVADFISAGSAGGLVDGWIGQWEEDSTLSTQRVTPSEYYPDVFLAPYAWYDWGRLFQRLTSQFAPCLGCSP